MAEQLQKFFKITKEIMALSYVQIQILLQRSAEKRFFQQVQET